MGNPKFMGFRFSQEFVESLPDFKAFYDHYSKVAYLDSSKEDQYANLCDVWRYMTDKPIEDMVLGEAPVQVPQQPAKKKGKKKKKKD